MKLRWRTFFVLGSVSAATGVALGAFAAHGLRSTMTPEMLAIFDTGVRYQMYHAFGLLITALAASSGFLNERFLRAGAWCFFAGTILFSGSLYALAFTGMRECGAITPFGGIAFIGGWIALALSLRTR